MRTTTSLAIGIAAHNTTRIRSQENGHGAAIAWRRCLLLVGFGLLLVGGAEAKETHKAIKREAVSAITGSLPPEITPDGVKALIAGNVPFLLVNADAPPSGLRASAGPLRLIYYTATLSFHAAQRWVLQDRNEHPAITQELIPFASQRLTGTPLDWQKAGLRFSQEPLPTRPLLVTPKNLSEAIKDGVDLQLIDLRPLPPGRQNEESSSFPQAWRLLPHEVESNQSKLSKLRWIVLIDDGNGVAQPIAERLYQQGFVLTTVLEGGYPAWVTTTDR